MTTFPERVFSGVQPTGNLHLGNYLGAIKRFVALQVARPCLYCVVDLHAMTLPHEPAHLARTTREVTAAFLACGIDPKINAVFNQSRVAEHAELAWVLDCVARMGWLSRMTQFKEKAGKDRENASVGLFNYPVLMAADILIYRATHVPVGEDQKQHLELARDIAQKFNNDFAESIAAERSRRRVLSSARAAHPGRGDARHEPARRRKENVEVGRVGEFLHRPHRRRGHDRAEDPQGQDRSRAAAASSRRPRRRPEADNLVGIFAALTDRSKADVLHEFGGSQFSAFKTALADLTIEKLAPIRAEMLRLAADPGYVDVVLPRGRESARHRAPEHGRDQGYPRPHSLSVAARRRNFRPAVSP